MSFIQHKNSYSLRPAGRIHFMIVFDLEEEILLSKIVCRNLISVISLTLCFLKSF